MTKGKRELLQKITEAGGKLKLIHLNPQQRSLMSRMQMHGLVRWTVTKHREPNLDGWEAAITDAGRAALAEVAE